jgi:hypothetical protein
MRIETSWRWTGMCSFDVVKKLTRNVNRWWKTARYVVCIASPTLRHSEFPETLTVIQMVKILRSVALKGSTSPQCSHEPGTGTSPE